MTRLRITGGFWILLAVLLLTFSGRVLLCFALACLVHELGHWAAIRLLDGRLGEVALTGAGAVLRPRRLLSYRAECLTALAGPAASVLLALVSAEAGRRFGWGTAYLLAGLSLALAVFNLVPAGPLDGGRALRALLSQGLGPDRGEGIGRALTLLSGVGLGALGLWALIHGGNFTLLLCAGWLLARRTG